MLPIRLPRSFSDLLRTPPRAVWHRAPIFRPRLEQLEGREVPATATWDGGGPTNNWSERANWAGDVAPLAGDDLVFPAGAARLTNSNNFASGTSFHSLTFTGGGYTISGGSLNVLKLGAGGISTDVIGNRTTSSDNTYNGPIQLDGNRTIDVSAGDDLTLGGVLSGQGGIVKTGTGQLEFGGASANTYTGLTEVHAGILGLIKFDSAGAPKIAVPGDLKITGGKVILSFNNQIAATATLTVTGGGVLDLIGHQNGIAALNMTGGTVQDSASGGTLTLNGDVTAQATSSTPATISCDLNLQATPRTFTVNSVLQLLSAPTSGLVVTSHVNGDGLIKQGTGVLELNGFDIIDQVDVNAGTLLVNAKLVTGDPIALRNGATLGGTGTVGAVDSPATAQELIVSSLDDGDSGFTATGWTPFATSGGAFGDIHLAEPSTVSGNTLTASWTFSDLPSGFYRVFATWKAGSSRTTSAPYSLIDQGVAVRSIVHVDQEKAPVNGPYIDGIASQQIGGAVLVTSGTLKVSLSNVVDAEQDGAKVIADAVRIERLAGTLSPGARVNDAATLLASNSVYLGLGSTYRVDFENSSPGINSVDVLNIESGFIADHALLVLSSSFFSPPTDGPGTKFLIFHSFNFEIVSDFDNGFDPVELVDGTGQRHTFTVEKDPNRLEVYLVYQNTATMVRDLRLSRDVINEGDRVTVRGALTDPNPGDALSLRVDWGDGAAQTYTGLGTNPFHFTHTYADNRPDGSPYLVRVEWFDQHGAGNVQKLFVTVNNVPPRFFLGGTEVVFAGQVMNHIGRFTDSGRDTWTATVDYGDESGVQPLPIQSGQRFVFEHRYQQPGTYHVTVTVTDDDGGVTTDAFLVIVLPLTETRGRGKHLI